MVGGVGLHFGMSSREMWNGQGLELLIFSFVVDWNSMPIPCST